MSSRNQFHTMEHAKKDNLIIRADASASTGMGHLMRCLALGQAWKDNGGQVHFITACQNESLLQRLRDESFSLHLLDTPHPDDSDWRHTKDILSSHPGSWVVLDGYHFDGTYQQKVKDMGLKLLVIDDTAHLGHYYADILLNQNLGAEKLPYSCESYTRPLLGTRYVLLRREFQTGRHPERQIGPTARKVLVSLGGSDPGNHTMKMIQALQKLSLSGLEVVATVGASNPHADELEATIKRGRIHISTVRNAQNMLELMTWADMAVSSGGTTIWELAFTGVPTIIVIQMENQRIAAEALHHAGASLNLGWADRRSIKELSAELERFLRDKRKRQEMSQQLQALVDGDGLSRLRMHMKGEKLRLRRVREEDRKLLWEWANDPVVREASFNTDSIPWETHIIWFNKKIADSNCLIFVFFNDEDTPVGQMRFETSGREAESNVSVSASHRSIGYGSQMIQMASQRLFRETGVKKIYAHIKPENKASIRAFKKAGYKPAKTISLKGHRALQMVLNKV